MTHTGTKSAGPGVGDREPTGGGVDDLADARRAVDLAYTNPEAADLLARRVADRSTEPAVSAMAARARGMAATARGELATARVQLRSAARLARRSGRADIIAEVALSTGWLQVLRGEPDAALAETDVAAAGLIGVDRARAIMLRGLVYSEAGRGAEAETAFALALADLARAGGDPLLEADIRTNRSINALALGHLRSAALDLEAAQRGYRAAGHQGRLAMVRHNQALLADLTGDLPTALRLFDEAADLYRAAGRPSGLLPVERATALLAAMLVPEARAAADRAAAEFLAAGNRTDAVQALVLSARAALLGDDHAAARAAAATARREAIRQRRPAWAALAGSVQVQAEVGAGQTTGATRRLAAACERSLVDGAWWRVAVDLRLTQARLALADGRPARARQLLVDLPGDRRKGPAEQRARAWHAEAMVRLAEGRPAAARRALQAGLRVLDEFRAALGALELRATAAGHGVELARTGLDLALADGDATAVLEWAERWRAIGLRLPATPADDPVLGELCGRLRQAVMAGGAGIDALERAVRDRARQLGAAAAPAAAILRAPELRAALGDRVLVEYVAAGSRLLAVVTAADLPPRLVALPDAAALDERVDALRHALRVAAAGTSAAAGQLVATRAARLDSLLLGPVAALLGDRELVIVPTRSLHALPWAALPSCVDRPVSVSPSAALWCAGNARPGGPGRTVLIGGPGLPAAATEIGALARMHPDATRLTGRRATVEDCVAAMDGAAVAHIAAHGVFRADSPLFSALRLADGPLTGFDLLRLRRPPGLVVLSACESGVPSVHPGDELLGLGAALLSGGTSAVVCTAIPVPDRATKSLMLALHRHLRAGIRPAEALRRVRAAAADPISWAAAAGFGCIGVG